MALHPGLFCLKVGPTRYFAAVLRRSGGYLEDGDLSIDNNLSEHARCRLVLTGRSLGHTSRSSQITTAVGVA